MAACPCTPAPSAARTCLTSGLLLAGSFCHLSFSPGKVSLPKTKQFLRKLSLVWSSEAVWWYRGSFVSLL